jgi:DNA-binding CsgD family transcriptional regulator
MFGSEERFLLQLIAPHIAQAWHAATTGIRQSASAPPSAIGVVEGNATFRNRCGGGRTDQPLNRLITLGLTPREAEVMMWVSKGKTSSEVATILSSTTGTVNKHLEHIFAKLNVETRTAAAAIVLDALR